MSLARLVITAVTLEGRTKSEVARDYGVSRRWVHELVRRFEAEGEAGLEPRSRRPRVSPHQIPDALEQEIVELRKALADEGLDAGAHTIAFHLERRHGTAPAVSTIWRVLKRRGFVSPQPQKRPKSSFVRFEAAMPNERWQADTTHWRLADGTDIEILNVLDDHSRFLVGSCARIVFKAADVVASFHQAAAAHGLPASLLTDNGAVFTAVPVAEGAARSRSSATARACACITRAPTTPRPAARSSGSTRRSRRLFASGQPHERSGSSKASSTGSAPTTTPNGPTERSAGARPRRPTRRAPRRPRAAPGSRPTAGSAETGWTQEVRSPCATTAACTTSRSAVATRAPGC
jgi:transposase